MRKLTMKGMLDAAMFVLWMPVGVLLVWPMFEWPRAIWRAIWSIPTPPGKRRPLPFLVPWLPVVVVAASLVVTGLRSTPAGGAHGKIQRTVGKAQDDAHAALGELLWRYLYLSGEVAAAVTDNPADKAVIAAIVGTVQLPVTLFVLSLLFLGPLHILMIRLGPPQRTPMLVAGRRLRERVNRSLTRPRREAEKLGTWFVGRSLTGQGAVLFGPERQQHTWVVGGTGSGKTAGVIVPALRADILAGRTVVFIDGKADVDVAAQLFEFAREAGREKDFLYLNLSEPHRSVTYSPLIHGTATEKKDKLIAAFEWSEVHYKKRAEEVALHLLSALEETGKPYCLDDVHAALSDIEALRKLAWLAKSPSTKRNLNRLVTDWKEVQDATTGLRTDLGLITECEFGGLFRTYSPSIDFWKAYRQHRILYIGLPTMRYQATAVRLARIMLSDLKTVAAKVQAEIPNHERQSLSTSSRHLHSRNLPSSSTRRGQHESR